MLGDLLLYDSNKQVVQCSKELFMGDGSVKFSISLKKEQRINIKFYYTFEQMWY
jgi:hypothetical protein